MGWSDGVSCYGSLLLSSFGMDCRHISGEKSEINVPSIPHLLPHVHGKLIRLVRLEGHGLGDLAAFTHPSA